MSMIPNFVLRDFISQEARATDQAALAKAFQAQNARALGKIQEAQRLEAEFARLNERRQELSQKARRIPD
jgi:hypothetical protein